MRGDTIIVEAHHRRAAESIVPILLRKMEPSGDKYAMEKYTISVAGESGSGKSETASAIAELLAGRNVAGVILQQDDYFVHPPKTNDRTRRKDISWVGPREVRLDLLDEHLKSFLAGTDSIEKPLVIYDDDSVTREVMETAEARVAIAEGTYTSLLRNIGTRIFIDRTYLSTRAHREKRSRDLAELDPFIDDVLIIEHEIISAHKAHADILVEADYSVTEVQRRLSRGFR